MGFFLSAFTGRELVRQLGGVLLGFGMLFLGIQFMGDATRPLRTFQPFIDLMQEMTNRLVGIAIGAVFTAIVQSSAATLGIIIALGSQGLMPLEAGIALALGANVGTVGTALLSAIGKPAEALQVGVVHLLFNCFGVLLFVFVIPQFADLVRAVSPSHPDLAGVERLAVETPRQIANAHTIFSVGGTLVLIWFTGTLGRLAEGHDLARFRDETTGRLVAVVIDGLERAVETIGAPDAAKAEIEALAAAARQGMFGKLRLDDKAEAVSFRLASDLLEQFQQVARFSRAIARTTQDF